MVLSRLTAAARGCMGVGAGCLLATGLLAGTARAQTAVYGEFTVSQLSNGPQGDYLYGATGGLLVDVHRFGRFVVVQGDLQGRFTGKNGERLDGAALGPRISVPLHFAGLAPYGEILVGFARYNDGANNATTDETFQANAGLTKRLTPHLDGVVEYSYEQYGAINNFYSPKSGSVGVVYHFSKR